MASDTFKANVLAHSIILRQLGTTATITIPDITTTTEQLQILNALIAGNSGSTVEIKIKPGE